jgi:hypothetical protein
MAMKWKMLAERVWICSKGRRLLYEMSYYRKAVAAYHGKLQACLVVAAV